MPPGWAAASKTGRPAVIPAANPVTPPPSIYFPLPLLCVLMLLLQLRLISRIAPDDKGQMVNFSPRRQLGRWPSGSGLAPAFLPAPSACARAFVRRCGPRYSSPATPFPGAYGRRGVLAAQPVL